MDQTQTIIQYRECRRVLHSPTRGPFFYDGCQRYVSGGPEGTLEGATCANCNCAKSYHLKVKVTVTLPGRTAGHDAPHSHGDVVAAAPAQRHIGAHGAPPTPHPSPFHPLTGADAGASGLLQRHDERQSSPTCCRIL